MWYLYIKRCFTLYWRLSFCSSVYKFVWLFVCCFFLYFWCLLCSLDSLSQKCRQNRYIWEEKRVIFTCPLYFLVLQFWIERFDTRRFRSSYSDQKKSVLEIKDKNKVILSWTLHNYVCIRFFLITVNLSCFLC